MTDSISSDVPNTFLVFGCGQVLTFHGILLSSVLPGRPVAMYAWPQVVIN